MKHNLENIPLEAQPRGLCTWQKLGVFLVTPLAAISIVQSTASSAEAAASEVRVDQTNVTTFASINILGSNHIQAGHSVGGSVADRAEGLVDTIEDQDFSLTALQEVEPDQSRMIKHKLDKRFVYLGTSNNQNPMIVNTDDFIVLRVGKIHYPYYDDRGLHRGGFGTTALLKNKVTGEVVNASDAHGVAWNTNAGSDKGGAQKRTEMAENVSEFHEKDAAKNPNHIQVAMHDGNYIVRPRYKPDRFTPKIKDVYYRTDKISLKDQFPYCIMTKKPTVLQSVTDMAVGRSGQCPDMRANTYDRKFTVDWVYLSPPSATPDYEVRYDYDLFTDKALSHSTDHRAVVGTRTVTPRKTAVATPPTSPPVANPEQPTPPPPVIEIPIPTPTPEPTPTDLPSVAP